MTLASGEIARRAGDRIDIRTQPLRLRWTLSDLTTADGHRLTCTLTCSVTAVDRAADRQMLAETFLARRDVVESADVVTHFEPALKAAAGQLASSKPAEQWFDNGSERGMADALRAAAKPIAFASGMELLPPFEVQLASPSVERLRIEAMERQLAERRAAGQVEHFQRAAELLRNFDALRGASPGISLGRVLEAVSPNDRGAMLQTLMAASGQGQAREVWGVGGAGLVRIAADGEVRTFDRPTEVGPPRSLCAGTLDGRAVWLIGCRSGVVILDAQEHASLATLRDPELQSSLGFSRVVLRDGDLTACHGEGGIVRWRVDQADAPALALRPAAAGEQARNLCELDSTRLLYSVGPGLVILDHESQRAPVSSASSHEIVALLPHDRELFVVHANGEVVQKDRATLETRGRSRHCGAVSAAALLPWVGGVRILMATQDGPVCCVGVEDSVVTQYVSPHRGLKALCAADGLIAAISADRQRIVLWNSWDGRRPAAEVNVAARTRHRVADIAFAPIRA